MPDPVEPSGADDSQSPPPTPPPVTVLPWDKFLGALGGFGIEYDSGPQGDYWFNRGADLYGPILRRETNVGSNGVQELCAHFGLDWADFILRAAGH
jgi:hypothetical protein